MKKLKRILVFTITAICCALLYSGCTYDTYVSDSGTCGDNLQWTLDYETWVLNITGSGAMMEFQANNEAPWLYYTWDKRPISKVILSEGITTIGKYAFGGCGYLLSVSIPSRVTSIGKEAFAGCGLNYVTCFATTPPNIGNDCFRNNIPTLYVPASSVNLYKSDAEWNKYFQKILPISE